MRATWLLALWPSFTETLRVANYFSILEKVRTSLMLIYGEFGTIARISECLGLLINGGSVAL